MSDAQEHQQYLICDIRSEFKKNPFITFWRPDDAGYCYPLTWAGNYAPQSIEANWNYYNAHDEGRSIRFAVLRSVAEKLAVTTPPRMISGDAGPVVLNKHALRRKLLKAAYVSQLPR
ncbi:hypothetical protein [Cypionkella sinensis]|uniref:Uncharacterized protein n=1 Tax=Cypionkella sinensis TaxID=1756043 RepID=A0ABV7IVE3_9RHOB